MSLGQFRSSRQKEGIVPIGDIEGQQPGDFGERPSAAFFLSAKVPAWGQTLFNEFVHCQPSDRVLDLGRGTGDVLDYLPNVQCVGVGLNERYIEIAKEIHGNKREILAGEFAALSFEKHHVIRRRPDSGGAAPPER